jgi:hypothetical protein
MRLLENYDLYTLRTNAAVVTEMEDTCFYRLMDCLHYAEENRVLDLWEQYEAGELEEDPYYDDYLSNWYGNDPTYEALHATSLPAELDAYWEVLEN